MSSPKKRTRPDVAGESPVMTLNSLVLPAPLAPITARRSPAATENETSSMARSAPNVRVTPSSSRASPVASGVAGRSDVTNVIVMVFRPARVSRASWGRGDARGPEEFLLWLRAARHVARAEAHLLELLLGEVQPLVDLGNGLDHLVVEGAVGALGHFGDEGRADRLTVLVERDLARRRLQLQVLQRLAVLLLVAREVALDGVETVERRLHVDVVDVGEQRRAREAVLEVRLVVGDELLPFRRVDRIGHRTGGRRAQQRFAPLALEVEHGLVDRDRAADHRLVAAGLLILAEEVHGVGAAQHDQQSV